VESRGALTLRVYYSARSAVTGFTRNARRAGTALATAATSNSARPAAPNDQGSIGAAHADLTLAARNRIRQHAVESNRREQQGDRRQSQQHGRGESRLRNGCGQLRRERLDRVYRRVAPQFADQTPHGVRVSDRIGGRPYDEVQLTSNRGVTRGQHVHFGLRLLLEAVLEDIAGNPNDLARAVLPSKSQADRLHVAQEHPHELFVDEHRLRARRGIRLPEHPPRAGAGAAPRCNPA
jgi:hypothetical protein